MPLQEGSDTAEQDSALRLLVTGWAVSFRSHARAGGVLMRFDRTALSRIAHPVLAVVLATFFAAIFFAATFFTAAFFTAAVLTATPPSTGARFAAFLAAVLTSGVAAVL